jgi:hypothetical protein
MMAHDRENKAGADIVALAQQYLDGELTPDQQSLLLDRLRAEEWARTLFVRSLMQAAYLSELLAQQQSSADEPVSECATPGLAAAGRPVVDVAPDPFDAPAGGDPSSSGLGLSQIQDWLFGWRGLGLVVIAFAATLGALLFGRGERGGLADRPTLGGAVAPHTAAKAFDPRSIRLDSGSARVTLPNVGYMLIDGPADVDMIAPLRAKLYRGRIRVRVTEPSGHGFAVETPDGEVVDLSTEFGLDVVEGKDTGVIVFDGSVDLRVGEPAAGHAPRIERLTCGEGVTFNRQGEMNRVASIMTGNVATFLPNEETTPHRYDAVIVKVDDNLQSGDTKKFYEIVPGGFREDALAYVDRPGHEWNGVTKAGLPKYLLGADYVKTFSDDDMRGDMEIRVWLSRPAKLYVLFDSQMRPPKWLESRFRKITPAVGMDLGPWPTIGRRVDRGVGTGKSIDHGFRVWECVVKQPGVVTLGGNGTHDSRGRPSQAPYMYGIAAVALDSAQTEQKAAPPQVRPASSESTDGTAHESTEGSGHKREG